MASQSLSLPLAQQPPAHYKALHIKIDKLCCMSKADLAMSPTCVIPTSSLQSYNRIFYSETELAPRVGGPQAFAIT